MTLPKVPQRTTAGFAFSIVQRAIYESIAARQFGRAEIAEVLAFFNDEPPQCVFCGSTAIARWDHLISVFSGGDTVLGNMVPACSLCDDSKRHHPYMEWAYSDVPGSPKTRGIPDLDQRLTRIQAYVAHYEYAPQPLTTRLAPSELEELESIREVLLAARRQFEELVSAYRARTGSR